MAYQQKRAVKWAKSASASATTSPTIRDLAWAAGFMEGEAWFGLNHKNKPSASQTVAVHQKQREPLERLLRMFGGTVTERPTDKRWPNNTYWHWRVYGIRARGIMMTLYAFMSPRRQQQIRFALEAL